MTVHHFGTDVDPSHFVEVPGTADPDGSGNTSAPRRPAAGTALKARDAATLNALPDILTSANGYWSYSTTDVPQIQVSGDGGVTWVGPLTSAEAMTDATKAGSNALAAIDAAAAAQSTADQALTAATQGGSVTAAGLQPIRYDTVNNRWPARNVALPNLGRTPTDTAVWIGTLTQVQALPISTNPADATMYDVAYVIG